MAKQSQPSAVPKHAQPGAQPAKVPPQSGQQNAVETENMEHSEKGHLTSEENNGQGAAEQHSRKAIETGQPSPPKPEPVIELEAKVKELMRLAQEQGYLTYSDINDALPDNVIAADILDELYIKLRNLDVEIVDQAEVDRVKQPEPDGEEEKSRLDILDDPVRMYLKQMGQVALLTREQEVEISKRIECAENDLKRIIFAFGFAGKEHLALAEKLINEPPKERFDRVIVDKKVEGREAHLRELRKLIKTVRTLDQQVDQCYAAWSSAPPGTERSQRHRAFKKADKKLQDAFPRFFLKPDGNDRRVSQSVLLPAFRQQFILQ